MASPKVRHEVSAGQKPQGDRRGSPVAEAGRRQDPGSKFETHGGRATGCREDDRVIPNRKIGRNGDLSHETSIRSGPDLSEKNWRRHHDDFSVDARRVPVQSCSYVSAGRHLQRTLRRHLGRRQVGVYSSDHNRRPWGLDHHDVLDGNREVPRLIIGIHRKTPEFGSRVGVLHSNPEIGTGSQGVEIVLDLLSNLLNGGDLYG